MAALAKLFGIDATAPSKARVLELGCSNGANLLPMAEQLPEASFFGIDISGVAIAVGQKAIAESGLKNVELTLQDIADFPEAGPKFDYIIAHGVYSWVPSAIREKILAICAARLSENGVAYVSYNALPGWNLRRSLRDMMLYHAQNFADPKKKVQQARALLAFLAESVSSENSPYGLLLQSELKQMSNQPDNYLLHDILGQENTAFYFHDFVGRAGQWGLAYLGESSFSEMLTTNFPEKVRQTLNQLNNQIVAQEQYMDFLRNRSFRQTLLCRATAPIRRNIAADRLGGFSFRSLLQNVTAPVNLMPGIVVTFRGISGAQVTSSDAFVKALLWALAETNGVAAISYQELLDRARARSRAFLGEILPNRDEIDEATLKSNLLNLLAKGAVELYAETVRAQLSVPEKPAISALARYEALNSRGITNRVHQSVAADLLVRHVIAACDGTRDRNQIVEVLIERTKDGSLHVSEASAGITDTEKLREIFHASLARILPGLANSGFFVP